MSMHILGLRFIFIFSLLSQAFGSSRQADCNESVGGLTAHNGTDFRRREVTINDNNYARLLSRLKNGTILAKESIKSRTISKRRLPNGWKERIHLIMEKEISMIEDLQCLGGFLGGHKYFGFDPRKGNEISWRYTRKGFYQSFPRPRLKKLYPAAVQACANGVLECIRKLASFARDSYATNYTMCGKKRREKLPPGLSVYHPFDSAIDLFRFRTTASYFLCWHTLNRRELLKKFLLDGACTETLKGLREPLDNQKNILDFRNDKERFQCALLLFCPDPCYGRKTKGTVPDGKFLNRDPGNPCRGLKDKLCQWDFHHNRNFQDLQKNRFNITCQCDKERKGFAWNSKYHLCVDIDECSEKSTRDQCGDRKRCQNTVGGYECLCRTGFLLDRGGRQCQEHVKLPRPVFNRSLLNARRLHKLLQPEGSLAFLRRQMELALGLSGSCTLQPVGVHLLASAATLLLASLP